MEILYSNNKLKKQITDLRELDKAFGQLARQINKRVSELTSCDNLSIMKLFPQAKCHELSGNRKGQLAIKVSGNFRIIFIPNHNPVPEKEDGGMNWVEITSITIIEVSDYH